VAFYSDKHSICRVNHEGSTGRARGVTQFGRALTELNIDIICANSPQAKGRVERMNKTLQDRLVKELRLRGVSTMEAGNAFLPEFMADYNQRFGRTPKNAHDAHRPLRGDEDLSRIFSWQEERTMSRNLVVHFKRVTYLVEPGPETLPFGASASASSSGRTVESRSAARVDCFPPRRSTRTDASTRARSWRTSVSAQSSRSCRPRSCSVTRHACARRKSPFGRRSASWLLMLRLGHRRHPQTQPCPMASTR